MYLDTTSQHPVSRLEVFANPPILPSRSMIHYGLLGIVNELGCHAEGLRRVSRGQVIMEAYTDSIEQLSGRLSKLAKSAPSSR
jgi:hypothetical protein